MLVPLITIRETSDKSEGLDSFKGLLVISHENDKNNSSKLSKKDVSSEFTNISIMPRRMNVCYLAERQFDPISIFFFFIAMDAHLRSQNIILSTVFKI